LRAAVADVGDDIAGIEALIGRLDPRHDTAANLPGIGAIERLGVVAQHAQRRGARPTGVHSLGFGFHQGVQSLVPGQAEDVLDGVLLAPLHRLPAAIVAVAADGDHRVRPVPPDPSHQTAQMAAHFPAVRRLARPQNGQHAVAAGRIIDVQRHEAAFVVIGVEQRQRLIAMHRIVRVVDVEGDRLGRMAVALAP
jgi:hypothetical protein